MPTALTKFVPFRRPDCKCTSSMQSSSTYLMKSLATITSLDARAIAYQELLVITTPNMDWVPELHNDDSELRARADGHFGLEDCFQWPQKYCKEFEYAVGNIYFPACNLIHFRLFTDSRLHIVRHRSRYPFVFNFPTFAGCRIAIAYVVRPDSPFPCHMSTSPVVRIFHLLCSLIA
jgi:hypothetical protein